MKIISWNVNGLRAVYKKGFLDWVEQTQADIICLQEIKAQPDKLPWYLLKVGDFYSYFNSADKSGYSGVAVYTKKKPLAIEDKLGIEQFDEEGRMLKLKFSGFTLFNFYLPHGGRQKENYKYKLEVYSHLIDYLQKVKNQKLLLIGDFNIAHKEIDVARPKQNLNNIMFTLRERKQIDKIIKLGFTDTFRKFHQEGECYTWWAYIGRARERNLGWRIDYAFASKPLTPKVKKAFILSEVKGSDHCPIGIEIKD